MECLRQTRRVQAGHGMSAANTPCPGWTWNVYGKRAVFMLDMECLRQTRRVQAGHGMSTANTPCLGWTWNVYGKHAVSRLDMECLRQTRHVDVEEGFPDDLSRIPWQTGIEFIEFVKSLKTRRGFLPVCRREPGETFGPIFYGRPVGWSSFNLLQFSVNWTEERRYSNCEQKGYPWKFHRDPHLKC